MAEYKQKLKISREAEYHLRTALCYNNQHSKFYIDHNDDVNDVAHFLGCFSKSLPHNEKSKPEKEEVLKMLLGIRKCKCYFNKIKYPGQLKLLNPSSIYGWNLSGPFKSNTKVESTPSITSLEAAADMIELYEMALSRDLRFDEYQDNTLFRGNTKGDLIGPYISQFLWLPFNHGLCEITQKYKYNTPRKDFMTTWDNVLSVQNGMINESFGPKTENRYMITLRDLTGYIHLNDPLQVSLFTSLILDQLKCPTIVPINQINESLFVDLGSLDLQALLSETIRVATSCCWYHKWNILKIRPEALGIQIQQEKSYIHHDLLSSNVIKRIFDKYKSYLLPQAFPEGSQVCPSYPSSHAVAIGAGTTLLKAFYEENFLFDAYFPTEDGSKLIPLGTKLRIGDELDKLASNIAMGCCAAGVNYRSDTIGLELGEEIAIKMLEETVHKYTYNVTFKFHKRSNELIEITNNVDEDTCK